MRFFNITTQKRASAQRQAIIKEYVRTLQSQVNSLFEYLHYYNPEWRVLGEQDDNSELSYYFYNNNHVTANTIINNRQIDISKLGYRWGFRNSSTQVMYYDGQTLNIGAIIYKKDAYDVSQNDADKLSHYIVFESSLAQYYIWTFSGAINDNNEYVLRYTFHKTNELDYGLSFTMQVAEQAPRYFYNSNNEYQIKYKGTPFDIDIIYDYNNTNVQVDNNQSESNTYYPQLWQGNSFVCADVMYKNNGEYEDLIADTVLYERGGQKSEIQVRLDKNASEQTQLEDSFVVFFY